MEKILTIDGRQVKFKSTGAFLLRYKAQFHRDAIKDIYKMVEGFNLETKTITNIETLDLEVFYNLVWILAKTADPSLPPPIDWLDSFSEFPLEDILPELFDMMFSSLKSSIPSKKK